VERLAEEQAGLRRVATLVAHESPGADVFAAVADEAGRVRHGHGRRGLGQARRVRSVGTNMTLDDTSVSALVLRTERPARMDDYSNADGPVAEYMRSKGIRSAVGTPILVEGRVWGAVMIGSLQDEPLRADTGVRIGGAHNFPGPARPYGPMRVGAVQPGYEYGMAMCGREVGLLTRCNGNFGSCAKAGSVRRSRPQSDRIWVARRPRPSCR
jgi:hypothetical protein